MSNVVTTEAERVYTQCPKALIRSKLWDPTMHVPKSDLPTSGEMLEALKAGFDGARLDEKYDAGVQNTLY